ncbi:N-acetylglucosaminidase, partial [Clostridium folliculivorans]|uniref:N-acetylglucosaminidase n=1 Tax=Clostridium folliculivorans TaxID=2886038 RepID=UPI0021C26327
LRIDSTTNSGQVISQSRNVVFNNIPKLDINSISNWGEARGNTYIGGWALSGVGIKNINVSVDDTIVGQATYGYPTSGLSSRVDYPQRMNAGYGYWLDTVNYTNGNHRIAVTAIANDNSSYKLEYTLNFQNNTLVYTKYNNTLDNYSKIEMKPNGMPQIYDTNQKIWRDALQPEVAFYMNPDNFINDDNAKYMFLRLDYSDGIKAWQLDNVLKGKGILEGKGQVFIDAGRLSNVNPIYLVSHALLETGNGTSDLATGKIIVSKMHNVFGDINSGTYDVDYKMVYNVFGIGALDANANLWGAEKAYSEKWFTIDDAIRGGAKWIGASYIANSTYNQNTLYKMRWDFTTDTMWHQYATDVQWAYKQTFNIKKLIDDMDDPILHFDVPSFSK